MYQFAVKNYLLKLQLLQNKVLRTIGNFPRRTPGRDLYMAFKLPYIYIYIYICVCVCVCVCVCDCTANLRRQQAEVMQNHENANVRKI
jgi:hypothetical protein